MKRFLILILTGLLLCSCGTYKLAYIYNDKGEITEEYLVKKTKTKQLDTYELLDEHGKSTIVSTMDLTNKEKNKIKKRLK